MSNSADMILALTELLRDALRRNDARAAAELMDALEDRMAPDALADLIERLLAERPAQMA